MSNALFQNSTQNAIFVIASIIALIGGFISDGYNFLALFVGVFIVIAFAWEYYKNKKINHEIIHIPLIIKAGDGPEPKTIFTKLAKRIEENHNFSDVENVLQKYFGLTSDELIFQYNGSIYEKKRLISFAQIIKYRMNLIEKQLNKRIKFHVAYYRYPSIGIILGSIFSTEGLYVYQNSGTLNDFHQAFDIKDRKYKEEVKTFSKYYVMESIANMEDDHVLIALESASHNINFRAKSLEKFQNIIKIELRQKSTIPVDEDWTSHAAEIYTVINKAQTRFSKITIAHSMPESLAIVLGMGLENYWDIDILQYDNRDYQLLMNTSDVKYYF